MDYKIIAFESSSDVEIEVKKALLDDWKLLGGVSITTAVIMDAQQMIPVIRYNAFAQAMTKG